MKLSQNVLPIPGLTLIQAQIYRLLIEHGQVTAGILVNESGLPRSTVYKILYELVGMKLVIQEEIKKVIRFKAVSPSLLLTRVDQALSRAQQEKETVSAMLPELSRLYIESTERPVVRVYEGVEGLKKIYLDTIEVGETIYAAHKYSFIDPKLREWLDNSYIRKRVTNKIHAKVIVAMGPGAKEYKTRDTKELRISKLVQDKLFPFQHEINIYGDRVAFIHFKKGEELVGVLIRHPNIAITMKALFDLAWIGAS